MYTCELCIKNLHVCLIIMTCVLVLQVYYIYVSVSHNSANVLHPASITITIITKIDLLELKTILS